MDYYRLLENLDTPAHKWRLGSIVAESKRSVWDYVTTNHDIEDKWLGITLRKIGIPSDFTFADFEVPVVNEVIKDIIANDEAQFIPLKIQGFNEKGKHFLMYIKNECDCVDEQYSTFDKFEKNDPIRPDKAGQYKTVYKLIINVSNTQNLNIFRIKGYNVAVIISAALKQKMEELGITGVLYHKVTIA